MLPVPYLYAHDHTTPSLDGMSHQLYSITSKLLVSSVTEKDRLVTCYRPNSAKSQAKTTFDAHLTIVTNANLHGRDNHH